MEQGEREREADSRFVGETDTAASHTRDGGREREREGGRWRERWKNEKAKLLIFDAICAFVGLILTHTHTPPTHTPHTHPNFGVYFRRLCKVSQ